MTCFQTSLTRKLHICVEILLVRRNANKLWCCWHNRTCLTDKCMLLYLSIIIMTCPSQANKQTASRCRYCMCLCLPNYKPPLSSRLIFWLWTSILGMIQIALGPPLRFLNSCCDRDLNPCRAIMLTTTPTVPICVTQHKKASNHHANLPLEMYSFTL